MALRSFSSDQHAKLQIINDHYEYGDIFLITSQFLESTPTTIPSLISLDLLLRGWDDQALNSTGIPDGLPPLEVFAYPGLGINVSRKSTLTSITYIPPGDLNRDGFVGIDDLGHVLASWNQTFPPGEFIGDPSGDGFVGIDDLNLVLANWNAGSPPINPNPIPEPTTLSLLALGALSTLHRQHN